MRRSCRRRQRLRGYRGCHPPQHNSAQRMAPAPLPLQLLLLQLLLLLLMGCAGDTEATLARCCRLGSDWARAGQQGRCQQPPAAAAAAAKAEPQPSACLGTASLCCLGALRRAQCAAGKAAARGGASCLGGEHYQDCCEACKLGMSSGFANMDCNFQNFSFGLPWDAAYRECCIAAAAASIPNSTTELDQAHGANTVDPAPGGETLGSACDPRRGQMCGHLCVSGPSPGSHHCACRTGFTLTEDGRGCRPDSVRDRCKVNNPCEYKCLDTGFSIECSCPAGYTLGPDERSCVDIDECILKLDICAQNDLVCKNEPGGYTCISQDGADETSQSIPVMNKGLNANINNRCPAGYAYNSTTYVCDDINECELNPLICNQKICENEIGSYSCSDSFLEECPPGYEFNATELMCIDIDECLEGLNNCNLQTEFCLNTEGNYTCERRLKRPSCPAGYKLGKVPGSCEDVDECAENIHSCILDKETCRNTMGAYECDMLCVEGFQYSRALRTCVDVNECLEESHTCSIGELCLNIEGGFSCNPVCSIGYMVDPNTLLCVDIDECQQRLDTCRKPNEYCKNKDGSYICLPSVGCQTGFRKSRTGVCEDINECEEQLDICSKDTEVCINEPGAYRCGPRRQRQAIPSCSAGFKYDSSQKKCIDIDECMESFDPPCDSTQICVNELGGYQCKCKPGFQLDIILGACVDINECQTNQHDCTASQRCDNTVGSFHCIRFTSCGTGYTLNAQSGQCEDDDECMLGTDTCRYSGPTYQCRNIPGSFRCEKKLCSQNQILLDNGECKDCPAGFHAAGYSNCVDINECDMENPCRNHQRCVNTNGSYMCVNNLSCGGGFKLNERGTQCIDIDECAESTHQCTSQQTCHNRQGGYTCQCPPGHSVNVTTRECEDINECQQFGSQICPINSVCENNIGSFHCKCNSGFKPAGEEKCSDIDECTERPGVCHQKCINVWGSYRCACDLGYILQSDKRTCRDVDECEEFKNRNLCIGTCVNEPGSYTCRCPEGYRLGSDRRTCQDINECSVGLPCRGENEICVNTLGGFRCPAIECPPGFSKDPAHKNRCKRDSMFCLEGDVTCFRRPTSYSYNFITFVSNIIIPQSGHLDLFTMRGLVSSATVSFSMDVTDVRAPYGIPPATKLFFQLRQGHYNQGIIALVRPIKGPQEVELELVMELHQNGLYTSRAVAKLIIFVSEYEF